LAEVVRTIIILAANTREASRHPLRKYNRALTARLYYKRTSRVDRRCRRKYQFYYRDLRHDTGHSTKTANGRSDAESQVSFFGVRK